MLDLLKRPLRFLVDAQLPPALSKWLVGNGHPSDHVAALGMGMASDEAIWSFADRVSAVIITKDADFAERHAREAEGPVVVWVRVGNNTRGALLAWFAAVFPEILRSIEQGETLIEVV